MRGFAARFSSFHNQNRGAALAQGDRKGEADDASANNDYVPSPHLGIVKELDCRCVCDSLPLAESPTEDDRERFYCIK